MGSKTLTISLPEELLTFLDENSSLSASKVFQGALINIRDTLKSNPQLIEANKLIALQERQINRISDELSKHSDFLEEIEMWDKFLKRYPK